MKANPSASVRRHLLKRGIALLCLCALMLLSVSCNQASPAHDGKTQLVLTASEKNGARLRQVVEAFNRTSDAYEIIFETYKTEEIKNYYFGHGAATGDIIAFDYSSIGLTYRDSLLPMNRLEITELYQVSIMNDLRAIDGQLYFIPSPGDLYSNCYNDGLLAGKNQEKPNTLSELLTLADRLDSDTDQSGAASATVGGDESVLCALMSIACPYFLNSVKGTSFLKQYLNGKVKMGDEEYRDEWVQIFRYLYKLYELNYYTLSERELGVEESIRRFLDGKAYAMQNTPQVDAVMLNEALAGAYSFAPFVGASEQSKCVGVSPMYYLGISTRASRDPVYYDGVLSFLEFYSSAEGQKYIRDFPGALPGHYISYLKNVPSNLGEEYRDLERYISENRIFAVDYFFVAFSGSVHEIVKYLRHEIDLDDLIASIDHDVAALLSGENEVYYNSEREFDFDRVDVTKGESEIGNYYMNALLKGGAIADDNIVMLPSETIRANLLKGRISGQELGIVFEDCTMQFSLLSGKAILHYYHSFKDSVPLMGNLTCIDGTLYAGGEEIDPEKKYIALLPKTAYAGFLEDWILGGGKEISTEEMLRAFLAKEGAIR